MSCGSLLTSFRTDDNSKPVIETESERKKRIRRYSIKYLMHVITKRRWVNKYPKAKHELVLELNRKLRLINKSR